MPGNLLTAISSTAILLIAILLTGVLLNSQPRLSILQNNVAIYTPVLLASLRLHYRLHKIQYWSAV